MKSVLKFSCGIAAILAMSGVAQAGDLFQDVALDRTSQAKQVNLNGQFRSRQVAMDKRQAKTVFNKFSPAKSLSLTLFPGRTVTLNNISFDRDIGDGYSNWSGRVDGFEQGSATLVVKGNRMVGQVQYGSEVYRITPQGDGLHTISQLDLSLLPDEAPDLAAPESPMTRGNLPPRVSQAGPDRIRVVVMFTPEAATEMKNTGIYFRDEARLSIAMANTALANTQLKAYRYKLAGMQSTYCNYVEPAEYSQPLYDITDSTTCIGGKAAAKRDANSADLVALIRSSGGAYCGVAWRNATPTNPDYGFSLTSLNCIAGHTFTHEIGHNIGLHHDRYVVNNDSPDEYYFGIARPELATPTRTVMAYNRACSDVGKYCTRVPLFTNTHKNAKWNGERFGVAHYRADAAVNRKKITDNWAAIAAWR